MRRQRRVVHVHDKVLDPVQVTPEKGGPVVAKTAMDNLSEEPGADGVLCPTVAKTAMN